MISRTTGAVLVLALAAAAVTVARPGQAAVAPCQGHEVTISATRDSQEIKGTDGDDVISTAGFDRVTVWDGGGNDLVCATTGRHAFLVSGPGSDGFVGGPTTTISYSQATAAVRIDLASGTVVDGADTDTVAGIHRVVGTSYADTFVGSDGDDTFTSWGAGDAPWDDAVVVRSGAGDDTVRAEGGGDIDLGPGDDEAVVVKGTVDGGAGDDELQLVGSGVANGGPGRDLLTATAGVEDYGPSGEGARLVVNGGAGRDVIAQPSTPGRADVDGGSGRDTLTFGGRRAVVDLAAGSSRTGYGRASLRSIENVVGSSRDDVIRGNSADNRLTGGGGIDVLIGRGGRDTAVGGPGRDRCVAEVRRTC